MRALTPTEIIRLWEAAYRLHPIDQVLSILLPVMREQNRNELAALPLSQRNALLLTLRRATFGDALPGKNHCPECSEMVEFELSCRELATDATKPEHKHISLEGYSVTIRPLNSFDLAAAACATALHHARDLLLQRCVVEARHHDKIITPATLPEGIRSRVTETVAAADPQAEILLNLNCPSCGHQWQSLLDIGHILWQEISTRAQRLLMDVHLLARAYGWAEEEILKLSDLRRSAYLQMVAT
ncbi:MAG: hypothetical protein GY809_05005 [Planctomycetes bacterium]|nr:hypothetical protein [Planctomycetota bacterium]